MKYLLPSFLLLPFAVLGTPVSSGLPAASAAPSANLTSSAGNFSIPGLIDTGTTVNGTDAAPNPEEWCPVPPPGAHVDIIDVGFRPFTVTGWFSEDNLSICVDLETVVHLSHCQGSLRDGEYVDCQIDKGRFFKGDLKLYIKNGNELWLHLDGTIWLVHWNKDIHIRNLHANNEVAASGAVSGMPSGTIVPTAASAAVYSSAYSSLPYLAVASAIAMSTPSSDDLLITPNQPSNVEAS